MAEPLLCVSALSKRFGSLVALSDISFNLEKGEVLGFVGRPGAGKSTLLHLICGMIAPSGGEIVFNGQRVNFSSPIQAWRQGIQLVHQVPQLVDQLDISTNIFLGREISKPMQFGIPDWERMYWRAQELLVDFDLPASFLRERTANLNNEHRQIVAITRALCSPCRLLLLDEVLSALSFQHQQVMLERIKELAEQGVSVIISSENLKHLFSVTDRMLVLYEAAFSSDRRTAECTPRDIVELIVGTSDREQVTPIIWALESYHAAQRQTEELHRGQATLRRNLETQDSLNRQLIERLKVQVEASSRLTTALQETQRRLMTEREEERKALARELHDQVIQDLLSFNYQLEETESGSVSAEEQAELAAIRNGIRQVVIDLRQLCSDLRPPTIDNHGLATAIRSFAQEWAERNGMILKLDIDPDLGRLPEAIELSVFRIVQEGLNNIRKHAAARHVQLTLERTPVDSLLVRLVDDGQGINAPPDLASFSANKHFGLLGISERVALLGGTMEVGSHRSGGVTLQVEIPSPYPSA